MLSIQSLSWSHFPVNNHITATGICANLSIRVTTFVIFFEDLSISSTLVTQSIRSGAGNDLLLSSPTHTVSIDGPQELRINSFGGEIKMEAARDVTIRANNNGKVHLFYVL
jgi:hypothetical protein